MCSETMRCKTCGTTTVARLFDGECYICAKSRQENDNKFPKIRWQDPQTNLIGSIKQIQNILSKLIKRN